MILVVIIKIINLKVLEWLIWINKNNNIINKIKIRTFSIINRIIIWEIIRINNSSNNFK
jgi:hypothetical protein